MNQDHQNVTSTATDELRVDQLDNVTGGDKNTTKSTQLPTETVTMTYGTILWTYNSQK